MTSKSKLVILQKEDIDKKLNRLACQILENHTSSKTIQFIGLNERGFQLSKLLIKKIAKLDKEKLCSSFQGFTESQLLFDDLEKVNAKHPIVIVDDVLNSGRSIYQFLALLAGIAPKQLEICVLADRHHKQFPIHANYVGLTFATTVQEHIHFDIAKPELFLK